MMEATNVAFNEIVREVLMEDNYENWSALVKHYLMGQDIWDVVSGSSISSEEERKKNAKALHAIQLSCGSNALAQIRKCETAKEAWNQLSFWFSSDLGADRDTELVILDNFSGGNDNIEKLRRHVNEGDWNAVKSCIDEESDVVFSSCSLGRTILHIAVIAGQEEIVKKLMDVVQDKERLLKMKENCGCTALALAAKSTNNVSIAKCMVDVCKELLTMKTQDCEIPVLLASANGHKDMTHYLYSETPWDDLLEDQVVHYHGLLLTRCISAEILNVALKLLQQNPSIALTHKSKNLRPLHVLAQMPHVFPSGRQHQPDILHPSFTNTPLAFGLLVRPVKRNDELKEETKLIDEILIHLEKRISKLNKSDLKCSSAYDAMLLAAKHGIKELIHSLKRANPDLLWAIDKNKRGIISYAILNRQLDLLDEIHESHEEKMRIISLHEDEFGNNMLHLAAEPSAPYLLLGGSSSPLQQLQSELQFFKKVEGMVHPKCKEAKNAYGKRPHEVFRESHEELAQACEKWAKGIATSVSLVGILVATVAFTAIFTVPGGFDQRTGLPIFLQNNEQLFNAFIGVDATAVICSAASVLVLARVPSSRNTGSYILRTLPYELKLSVHLLFYSVMCMTVAFCAASALMLPKERKNSLIAAYIAVASISAFSVFKLSGIRNMFDC